jgi:hypothetical protein
MSSIHVELPKDLGPELEALGLTDPSGIAEWVADAVRQKLSAEKQLKYLEARGARGSRDAYRNVLGKIPATEPAPEDCRTSG